MPRKKSYTGLPPASAIGLPDFNPADTDVLGSSMALGRQSRDYSPIAKAVSINSQAAAPPATDPTVLRGSPLTGDGPPPVQPPGQPPVPFQPPSTPPGTLPPTPPPAGSPTGVVNDPLPGTGDQFDPARLNYEGTTYTGPPATGNPAGYNNASEADIAAIKQYSTSIGLPGFWSPNFEAWLRTDPRKAMQWFANMPPDTSGGKNARAVEAISKLSRLQTFIHDRLSIGNAQGQFYDQALYNQALERTRQGGLVGAGEDEEQLLAGLQSRGLLNSGIAARELGQMRADRAKNYRDAANRLNEILFSNASDQAKREALTRLSAELETANQERLLRLKYDLETRFQKEQHGNDFLNFLSTVGGGIVGGLTAGPPGALYGAKAGNEVTKASRTPGRIVTSDYESFA